MIFPLRLLLAFSLGSAAIQAQNLSFQTNTQGYLVFDTGVVSGSLQKDGVGEGVVNVRFNEGNVRVDKNHGLLAPYRFLTPGQRFGGEGSWQWPRRGAVLKNGAAQLWWKGSSERPFDLSTVYQWKNADTLDFTLFFYPKTNLVRFELLLANYFERFLKAAAYMKEGSNGTPGFMEVIGSNGGDLQIFPNGSAAAVEMINDGRWKLPPHPLNLAVRGAMAAPLAYKIEPKTGASVLMMAPPQDCFALMMWRQQHPNGGVYFSLFGTNVSSGQALVGRARLVFGFNLSEAQAIESYSSYLKEITNGQPMRVERFLPPLEEANPPAAQPVARNWIESGPVMPDAYGWLRLFDGKKLKAATISDHDLQSGRITKEGEVLRLDNFIIPFNLKGRDMTLKVTAKKVSGRDVRLSIRANGPRRYMFWFGGKTFNLGKYDGKWHYLKAAPSQRSPDEFVDMEFTIKGSRLVGIGPDGVVLESEDSDLKEGGVTVGASGGISLIKRIAVKMY